MNTGQYLEISAVAAFLAAAAIVYFGQKDQSAPDQDISDESFTETATISYADGPERMELSDACSTWTNKGNDQSSKLTNSLMTKTEIQLEEASTIWVEPSLLQKAPAAATRPTFTHTEIDIFYTEMVENADFIRAAQKAAITRILLLLDSEGDCPSVVQNPEFTETNNKYKKDEFTWLASISLITHTLAVARTACQKTGKEVLIPNAMIAALCHDLGKIPVYHKKAYRTGDHPIISTYVMDGITECVALPNYDELVMTVKMHHSLVASTPLIATLKDSDNIVRNQELSKKINTAVQQEVSKRKDTAPATDTAQPTLWDARDNGAVLPQPDKEPSPKYTPKRRDISWLDPALLLAELRPWINVVRENRWGSVSQPDGMVYVNQDHLWKVMAKIAPDDIQPQLSQATADEASRRDILFSVVWTLSEKGFAIASDMIPPDQYMIPVTITTGTGRPVSGPPLLIPFRAEAFGVLASELENTKKIDIKRMVKTVKPRLAKAE